jgi:uncharacterized protein
MIAEPKVLWRELSFSEQKQLVAALCEAESLKAGNCKPQVIETHISYVVLLGDFAYKIKKVIDLKFLNFTTLRARRFYCDEEVRLNRRFAPDLYLGVVSITGTLDLPRIGGDGKPLEFAVKMRAFSQESLADNLVSKAQVLSSHIDELAATLAECHRAAKRVGTDTDFGEPESILAQAIENVNELTELHLEIDTATLGALEHWTRKEYALRQAALLQRKQAGYVRECHGDLHLGNIVNLNGRLTPFDCIEFNDSLRWIDVISDVAFLTMDLDFRRRQDLSARFLNQYLEGTGDYDAVELLRYYQVYRAMVRAKVAALKVGSNSNATTAGTQANSDCLDHLTLAQRYTSPGRGALMITHGFSGSGKTTLTQALLENVGAIRVRSDVERKRMFGLGLSDRSESGLGIKLYSPDANAHTYHRLVVLARTLLTSGYPVIVDATFLKQCDRQLFCELAKELGVPFAILDIYAPVDELRRRIAQRSDKGLDASEATLAVLEHQLSSEEPFTAAERPHVFWVNSTQSADQDDVAQWWNPLVETLALTKEGRS